MKKKALVSLLLAAILSVTLFVTAFATTYYSACPNGKPLNIRDQPNKNSKIIWTIPYGDKVYVGKIRNGWAELNGGPCAGYYVQASLLSKKYPGTKPAPKKKTENTGSSASYKSFKLTDYNATINSGRATGTVSVYWNPNTSGVRLMNLHNDDEVRVIAQTANWAQVFCSDGPFCGYVLRKYLVKDEE